MIPEKQVQVYLERIRDLNLREIAPRLGASVQGDEIVIPIFGKPFRVSKNGIQGPSGRKPEYFICIVLFKYMLMCPDDEPVSGDWQSFKDFRDAAPLISYFQKTVKSVLARHFPGRSDGFLSACKKITEWPSDWIALVRL